MAAKKYLVPIDLNKNEAQNLVVQNLASAPSSPVEGQIYYDTVNHIDYIRTNSAWVARSAGGGGDASTNTATSVDSEVALFSGTSGKTLKRATGSGIAKLTSGVLGTATAGTDYVAATSGSAIQKADGSGGLTAAAASTDYVAATSGSAIQKANGSGGLTAAAAGTDYAPATATTSALKGNGSGGFAAATLNDVGAATADYSINSHKLTNVTDPTSAQDAATKNYVDLNRQGLSVKDPVRVASTANGTLASAFANSSTVDGVTLATGDRILLKNQTTASENGIYIVAASGAPARATDADATGELVAGSFVLVTAGTANAGNQFTVQSTTATPWVPNSSGSTWVQLTGASTISAGAGLTATGNIFAVGAGTGIVANADSVTVDRATNGSTVPFKYTATIGDGSTTAIAVTHSLGTQDVISRVRDASTNAVVEVDIVNTSTTVTTFTFAVAPATNAYKVVIIG